MWFVDVGVLTMRVPVLKMRTIMSIRIVRRVDQEHIAHACLWSGARRCMWKRNGYQWWLIHSQDRISSLSCHSLET